MNRELQQVRRYWPKARYAGWDWHGWQSEDEPGVLYMRYSSERLWWRKRCVLCLDEEQGGWHVVDSNQDQIGRGDTIAEAMRAAGFGVRAQGLRQVMNSLKRNDCAGRILPGPRIKPHKWFVELQSCQRPRKGARLGKRKREVPDEP